MRYILTCLRCGVTIATTDHVTVHTSILVERHLRAAHPDVFAGRQHVDYAEVLGQVRVKVGD